MLFPGDILECLSAMSMPLADLIFLAFALSVDAFVVAFSYGLLIKQKRLSNGIKLSLSTGAGQFLMPVLGFLLTGSVHRYIAAWDHWLGFAVFTFLGVNVLREGWNHRNEEEDMPHVTSLTLPTLMAVGIATSIDALAVGVSFSMVELTVPIYAAAALIGCTTFAISVAGVFVGNLFGARYKNRAEFVGGAILILIGLKILLEHFGVL